LLVLSTKSSLGTLVKRPKCWLCACDSVTHGIRWFLWFHTVCGLDASRARYHAEKLQPTPTTTSTGATSGCRLQSVANENALSMCPAMMMLTKVKERACSPQCVEDGREGCVGACWDMVGERVCQWWQYTRYIHSFKGMRYHFQLLFSSVFLKKCSSHIEDTRELHA